jgi:hypothetical protein
MVSSLRVLGKLGFARVSIHVGSFGDTHLLRLAGETLPLTAAARGATR